jgi:hypothetical protein
MVNTLGLSVMQQRVLHKIDTEGLNSEWFCGAHALPEWFGGTLR